MAHVMLQCFQWGLIVNGMSYYYTHSMVVTGVKSNTTACDNLTDELKMTVTSYLRADMLCSPG